LPAEFSRNRRKYLTTASWMHTSCRATARARDSVSYFWGLLPTEWVNLDVFLQVEADFKGFLVNLMVMSSQARCAHAKIRQEETSAG
jgi:hypothetical protein